MRFERHDCLRGCKVEAAQERMGVALYHLTSVLSDVMTAVFFIVATHADGPNRSQFNDDFGDGLAEREGFEPSKSR